MSDQDSAHGVEQQLTEMEEKAGQLLERACFRSAVRLNGEIARLAKSNQLLLPYVYAMFHRMDQAQSTLEPGITRDCAIELIALMEDEDRARLIQPDLPQEAYEYTAQWMTACLYENLAEATGLTDGYNSDGMHQCIADGIQVCRRTGKLACVSCFREYATDVYTAADDATMALHQCQTIANHQGAWSNRGDRRWYAASRLSWLKMLDGHIDSALESMQSALELTQAEEVPLKTEARLRAATELDQALILAGRERVDWSDAGGVAADRPEVGEWPALDLRIAVNDALAAVVEGRFDDAIAVLTDWDRTLTRLDCRHLWFEVRLRLIAAMQMSGDRKRAIRLADQLRERATQSSDFLTLRRLSRLFDDSCAPTPIAALQSLDAGPFAEVGGRSSGAAGESGSGGATADTSETAAGAAGPGEEVSTSPDGQSGAQDGGSAATAPLEIAGEAGGEVGGSAAAEDQPSPFVLELMAQLRSYFGAGNGPVSETEPGAASEAESDALRAGVVTKFLSHQPADVTDARDTLALLHFAGALMGCGRERQIWEWAQTFLRQWPDEPSVLSMVATLGSQLRHAADDTLGEEISDDMLEKMFRLSLSMDAGREGNHTRAGEYFLSVENHGEAERCLARAFRLNHGNYLVAELLAQLYQQTDRPRDALNVLDVYLREGGDHQNVAWEAMLLATNLGQHEAALTYLDVMDRVAPDTGWAHYYRAMALIHLGRAEEALKSLEIEAEFMHSSRLPLDCLRVCALADLGRSSEADAALTAIIETPLRSVDELTVSGLIRLFQMLFSRAAKKPADDDLRRRFQQFAVAAGLAPDELFESARLDDAEPIDLQYFQVLIEQTLDGTWKDSPACLSGQELWDAYRGDYGVLATDEEHATTLVLKWQNLCWKQPADVLAVQPQDDRFRDRPGVVWQGSRWCPTDEADDDFEDGMDDPFDEFDDDMDDDDDEFGDSDE